MSDPGAPHLAWDKGGGASFAACEGENVALDSTVPSPPGSRPEGALATGERFKMKVHRCVKRGEGFRIEGRLLDATRAVRDTIRMLAAASSP